MKTMIVLKKELLDQIRDRRMIIAALLMPAVIVPILLFFLMEEPSLETMPEGVRIVMYNIDAATNMVLDEILHANLASFEVVPSEFPETAVRTGKAEFAFEGTHTANGSFVFTLHYDPARRISRNVFARINAALNAVYGETSHTDAAVIHALPVRSEPEYRTLLTLSMMLPVFLMVFSASTTMSSIIDMSAGEKERATLETLLSSPVSRVSVLLGKILAASLVGVTAGIALLAGLSISSYLFPEITGGMSLFSITEPGSLVLVVVVLSSCVLLFSATGMMLGLYAKSVKEGTVFSLPVIILVSVFSSGTIAGDPFLRETMHLVLPIINAGYSIRALLFGNADYTAIALTLASTVLYTCLMFGVSYLLLNREKVINRS